MNRKIKSNKIDKEVELLKQEIIKIRARKGLKESWTSINSNIIAILALIFSFTTTLISYNRIEEQDIHNTKNELRLILGRLSSLPKENQELMNKYKNNPMGISKLSGYIAQENIILANQAFDLIKKMPEETITGIEYYSVADAFLNIEDYDKAILLYKKAIYKINNINTEIAIHRSYANALYMNGKIEEGRNQYSLANSIFILENNSNLNLKETNHILTELCWAHSEISIGNRKEALKHIFNANNHLGKLPNYMKSHYENQIIQSFAIVDKYVQ